jgi:hypothetical protein
MREHTTGEFVVHRARRLEVDLLRRLNERIDDVRLSTCIEFVLVNSITFARPGLVAVHGGERLPSRRPLIEHADVQIAIQRQGDANAGSASHS